MVDAHSLIDRLLEDPEVREGYDEQGAVIHAGRLVRQMREAAELSQRQLAELLGTSQAHLSMIERGVGRYGPTFLLLNKIAHACGLQLLVTATPRLDPVDPTPAPEAAGGTGMMRRVTSLLAKGTAKAGGTASGAEAGLKAPVPT